jgi:MFS transporter
MHKGRGRDIHVAPETPSQGMTTFAVVWAGQLASLVGSALTSFALGVWVFERTGSATQFALIGLFNVLPRVLLSPLAGALVDRWDRRRVMIAADVGAALGTAAIFVLSATGLLQVWHIYLITAIGAAFGTVQWPAYAASTGLLVPERHLGRANGMVQFARAASEILAPVAAGFLVQTIRLEGVIAIDLGTFILAVGTLLVVRFPAHARADPGDRGTFWQEMAFGWTYITARRGLLGLLAFFAAVNFLWGMVGALIAPMILGFASSDVLGTIVSVAGVGMLAGSLAMSVWGGPRRRIHGVLFFEMLSGACFVLMGLRPSPGGWSIAAGAFGAHVTIAMVYGCNQAIWQRKVAPGVQGRVFAAQQMLARSTSPLAYLLAGPLAERLFDPWLSAGGWLSGTVGQVVGVGPGRGIGLMFIVMGLLKVAVTVAGYLYPRIRHVEQELPDAVASGVST